MVENTAERAIRAIVAGLVAGILLGLVLWVVQEVVSRAGQPLDLAPSWWGLVVGVITALYVFVTNRRV